MKILQNCKKAIPEKDKGVKVIIFDIVLMDSQKHNNDESVYKTQKSMDMDMLVFYGGKERNEKEWATLFQAAGFSDYKIFL